jgi:hypothetical protein
MTAIRSTDTPSICPTAAPRWRGPTPNANWFVGSFVNANNTADYSSQSVGFTVRYLMMQSPSNYNLQLNSIPDWKGGQFSRLQ